MRGFLLRVLGAGVAVALGGAACGVVSGLDALEFDGADLSACAPITLYVTSACNLCGGDACCDLAAKCVAQAPAQPCNVFLDCMASGKTEAACTKIAGAAGKADADALEACAVSSCVGACGPSPTCAGNAFDPSENGDCVACESRACCDAFTKLTEAASAGDAAHVTANHCLSAKNDDAECDSGAGKAAKAAYACSAAACGDAACHASVCNSAVALQPFACAACAGSHCCSELAAFGCNGGDEDVCSSFSALFVSCAGGNTASCGQNHAVLDPPVACMQQHCSDVCDFVKKP